MNKTVQGRIPCTGILPVGRFATHPTQDRVVPLRARPLSVLYGCSSVLLSSTIDTVQCRRCGGKHGSLCMSVLRRYSTIPQYQPRNGFNHSRLIGLSVIRMTGEASHSEGLVPYWSRTSRIHAAHAFVAVCEAPFSDENIRKPCDSSSKIWSRTVLPTSRSLFAKWTESSRRGSRSTAAMEMCGSFRNSSSAAYIGERKLGMIDCDSKNTTCRRISH